MLCARLASSPSLIVGGHIHRQFSPDRMRLSLAAILAYGTGVTAAALMPIHGTGWLELVARWLAFGVTGTLTLSAVYGPRRAWDVVRSFVGLAHERMRR